MSVLIMILSFKKQKLSIHNQCFLLVFFLHFEHYHEIIEKLKNILFTFYTHKTQTG